MKAILFHGYPAFKPVLDILEKCLPHRFLLFENHLPVARPRYEEVQTRRPPWWKAHHSRRFLERATSTLGDAWVDAIIKREAARSLPVTASWVETLERYRKRYSIELLVLNDDVRLMTKGMAQWARSHGIRSLHVTHANLVLNLLHDEIHTDMVAVCGSHNAQFFRSAVAVTGKPSWDVYAALSQQDERQPARLRLGLDPHRPVVMYGSTWAMALSARSFTLSVMEVFRRFLQAVPENVQLLVKLPPQHEKLIPLYQQAAGRPVVVTHSHLLDCLQACDVLVSLESNLGCEAILLGRPVINYRPFKSRHLLFDDSDAVINCYTPAEVSEALQQLLDEPRRLESRRPYSIERFNYRNDGGATARVADLIARQCS